MRHLILMRGSAGCGKSTWIKNNNLSQYAINADDIRLMFQSPVMNVNGELEISQKNDNKVWDFIFQLLEERMKRGELTIIDGTHSRSALINKYKKLCEKYRYRCTVVRFDISIEEILKRNSSREQHKIVPEDAIRNMVSRIETQPTPNWCKEISPENFWNEFKNIKIFDFNQYKNIIHIGDIHGCVEPLKEYFEKNPYSEDNFYIFMGDYIDRGIQNREVLEFLFQFMYNKNVLLLEGNHERWLRMWGDEDITEVASSEFRKYTMPQIEFMDKKQVREFCRKLSQIALYEYNNNVVFCNHGGYPVLPNYFSASDELIKGVGKYEHVLDVQRSWNTKTPDNYYQIHGHRNIENLPTKNERCFNLCDKIEFGGNLRVVTLNKNGFHEELFKNNTFFINEIAPEQKQIVDKDNFLESLLHHRLIKVKKLNDNVVSINFTREAFYDKQWNDLTMAARGLFVNLNTKEIVARSWEKFFNVGENSANEMQELKHTMVFPAKAYIKYNGYLGIVGYNSECDKLFIATKTTNQGDMQKEFRKILLSKISEEKLIDFCRDNNVSLVFEVLDPIHDPHIIKYEKQDIVLLDCVDRTWDLKRSLDVVNVSYIFGIKAKVLAYELENFNQFYEFVEANKNYDYMYDNEHVEGFVVEDSAGFMTKVKGDYYKFWKFMRSIKESLAKGRTVNTAWLNTPMQNEVYAFMKEKDRDILDKLSIIDIRDEFEKAK